MNAYLNACKTADSIREIDGNVCQVIKGSNDGYFIEAFGRSYRFATVECPAIIAMYFTSIVAMGPIEAIA